MFFNAADASAANGAEIVRYEWDFGNGTFETTTTGASTTRPRASTPTARPSRTSTRSARQSGTMRAPASEASWRYVFSVDCLQPRWQPALQSPHHRGSSNR